MTSNADLEIREASLNVERVITVLDDTMRHVGEDAYLGATERAKGALDLVDAQISACVALLREVRDQMKPYSA